MIPSNTRIERSNKRRTLYGSPWLAILSIFLLHSFPITVSAVTQYALYNIPPFAVTFQTQHTPALESALEQLQQQQQQPSGNNNGILISETNGIDSSLSHPLRTITQSFLKDRFMDQIIDLEGQENRMDPLQRFEWYDMYAQMVGVDLETKLYLVQGMTLEVEQDEDDQDNTRTRRSLISHVILRAELYGVVAFGEPAQVNAQTKPGNEQVWTVFGTWLQEIFATGRTEYVRALTTTSNQPLLQQISNLEIMTNWDPSSSIGANGGNTGGKDHSPSSPVRSSTYGSGWPERTSKAIMTMLILLCAFAFGYTLLVARQKIRKRYMMRQGDLTLEGNETDDDNDGDGNGNDGYNFNMAGASMGGRRPPMLSYKDRAPSTGMDAVRHGKDVFHRSSVSGAMSVLESTDRYLSKHRPDLYGGKDEDDDYYFNNRSSFQVFGREYSIPSNPFEYVYNAAATTFKPVVLGSPHGAFSAPNSSASAGGASSTGATTSSVRRPSMIPDIQRENIAARPFDEMEEEHGTGREGEQFRQSLYYHHQQEQMEEQQAQYGYSSGIGYRPMSSIWRNITNMWDYHDPSRPRSEHDGIVLQTPESSITGCDHGDLELQSVQFYPDDEDPADYNFAFKDFPRHDGTPCLIFRHENDPANGTWTPQQRQLFEIGSPTRSFTTDDEDTKNNYNYTTTNTIGLVTGTNTTTPVSDADFARMLAQHGHDSPNGKNSAASVIEHYMTDDDSSSLMTNSFFSDEPMDPDINPTAVAKSPSFKEKLGQLMQQKHRQYEKKAIVEKHQEKRAKERKLLREQERREKHKAMERQIEDMEAAFGANVGRTKHTTSTSTTTNNKSTNTGGGGGGGKLSPKPASRWTTMGQYHSPNPYGNGSGLSAAQQKYSPKPGTAVTSARHGYSPYRNHGTSTTNATIATSAASPFRAQPSPSSRPSPSRGNLGRSNSYNHDAAAAGNGTGHMGYRPSGHSPFKQQHRRQGSNSSVHSQRSLSPPGGFEGMMEDMTSGLVGVSSNSSKQPFRMRPRTNHPPHLHASAPGGLNAPTGPASNDLYVDTAFGGGLVGRDVQQNSNGSMDHSTLDQLYMPPMSSVGSNSSFNSFGGSYNFKQYNSRSLGSTPKYKSPNSVLDDFFGGAPTSISRKKNSTNSNSSVGGGSTISAPPSNNLTTIQPQESLRRVNSFDIKDSIARPSTPTTIGGLERPVPQQRRRAHSTKGRRALTPTREDVRTTLDGGVRTSTPTRGRGSTGMTRPLTPMTQYNMQRHGEGGGGGSSIRSGSNPRARRSSTSSNNSSSSSLSSTRKSHSRSNSLTAEDSIYTHGIVASTRFV